MTKRPSDDGFTLIELMVVVLIIAILIAIAIPTFLGLRERAQDRVAQTALRNGLTVAKAHFSDNDTYNGFDAPGSAAAMEPSITWDELGGAAADNVVSIRQANGAQLALVTRSASGRVLCVADDWTVGTVRGDDDAAGFSSCAGGLPANNTW